MFKITFYFCLAVKAIKNILSPRNSLTSLPLNEVAMEEGIILKMSRVDEILSFVTCVYGMRQK